jgi:hypothetical protein
MSSINTYDGAIPIDAGDDDAPSRPVTPDLAQMQLVGRVEAQAQYTTTERLAQKAETLPVMMSGAGWAAWVRSRAVSVVTPGAGRAIVAYRRAAEERNARIAIVGCGKRKLSRAAAARDLYTSNLFQLSLRHAEATCGRVYVASALHGLLELDEVIEPYSRRLNDLGGKKEREAWGTRVAGCLPVPKGSRPLLVIYAGTEYAEPLRVGAGRHGWAVAQPLRGLQLGERLRWLSRELVGG